MPKVKKPRETTNPIGLKFHAVMQEKGIPGDYAAVAEAFEVATPSVYDWIDHARISKERYARLVEWSGHPLDWWFDIPQSLSSQAAGTDASTPAVARDEPGVYALKQPPVWPFTTPYAVFQRLSEFDRGRVDGFLAAVCQGQGGNGHASAPKSKRR